VGRLSSYQAKDKHQLVLLFVIRITMLTPSADLLPIIEDYLQNFFVSLLDSMGPQVYPSVYIWSGVRVVINLDAR
jgi:hypothetical protein